MVEGDIEDLATCRAACEGVEQVVHQAAIGSVPRSMEDPLAVNRTNVDGFVNMLIAARDAGARRFVYASSCAIYGDVPGFPKREEDELRSLSPYATTKHVNELYAEVFGRAFGVECVGLRYFNVFGPRQDPDGPYAAVIPRWIQSMLAGEACRVFGTGEQTRDFVYVEDVVQANILASLAPGDATGRAYNIGAGRRTSLLELFGLIRDAMSTVRPELGAVEPTFEEGRAGDVPHSCADIDRARAALGYAPAFDVASGMANAVEWYAANLAPRAVEAAA
jgi:UDP-N-acetylglucosamine 4-epimerase